MAKYAYLNITTGGTFEFAPEQLQGRTPQETIADWNIKHRRGEFFYSYALLIDDTWIPKMFEGDL